MMTSWHESIFRITGPVCRESTGHRGFPAHKGPIMRKFAVFFNVSLNKPLNKQLDDGWCETPRQSLWRHWLQMCGATIVTTEWASWQHWISVKIYIKPASSKSSDQLINSVIPHFSLTCKRKGRQGDCLGRHWECSKTAFSISNDDQGSQPNDLPVSVNICLSINM